MQTAVTLEPDALYDNRTLRQALGLSDATLSAARRAGKLRHTRLGHRTLYRGAWVIDWVEAESKRVADEHGDER